MNNKKITVLIGSECDLAQGASNYLEAKGFETKIISNNSLEIQQEVCRFTPNVVIVSTDSKPTKALCQCIKSLKAPPLLLVVESNSDYFGTKDLEEVSDATILGGYDYEEIYKQILILINKEAKFNIPSEDFNIRNSNSVEDDLYNEITYVLSRLCVTPNYMGYRYLREAIKIAIYEQNNIIGISKDIYPVVAKKHKATSMGVERNIRTAIKRSWGKVKVSDKIELFGTYALMDGWYPTNSEYIFILADRLYCKLKHIL